MFFFNGEKWKRREKQMSSHIGKAFVRRKRKFRRWRRRRTTEPKKRKKEKVQRNDEGNNESGMMNKEMKAFVEIG